MSHLMPLIKKEYVIRFTGVKIDHVKIVVSSENSLVTETKEPIKTEFTAVIGEMLIPIILAPFYKGYSHATMAISILVNSNSPVRLSSFYLY